MTERTIRRTSSTIRTTIRTTTRTSERTSRRTSRCSITRTSKGTVRRITGTAR